MDGKSASFGSAVTNPSNGMTSIKSHLEQLAFLPLETKCHFSLHCQTSNAAFVSLPAATNSGPENGLEDEIIIW